MRGPLGAAALALLLLCPRAAAAGDAAGSHAPGKRAFDERRFEDARRYLAAYVARQPRDAAAAHWLGRTLYALGEFEEATEQAERAAELAPRDAEYHFWLGRAAGRSAQQASILRQPGLARKSRQAYERTVALAPDHLAAREDLIQFYLLAPSFLGGGVDKAHEQAAQIGRRDSVRGALARATIAAHQKDLAGAVRELEEAVRTSGGDARARMALGSLYQEQKRWDAAFDNYEAMLAAAPDHWDALYQIGRTGALSGRRLERAAAALERYLTHTPGPESAPLPYAHYRLGMVLEKKGDKAGARAAYEKAIRLDPKLEDARKALSGLG